MRKKKWKIGHKSLAKRILVCVLTVSFLAAMPINGVRASISLQQIKTEPEEGREPQTQEAKTESTEGKKLQIQETKAELTESKEPQIQEPETNSPEGKESQTQEPGTNLTEGKESQTQEPGINSPEGKEQQIQEPGTNLPEGKESEVDLPESNTSQTQEAESNPTETKTSESEEPEETQSREIQIEESEMEETGSWGLETEETDAEQTESKEPQTEQSETEETETGQFTTITPETDEAENETEAEEETELIPDEPYITAEDILVWKGKGEFGEYRGEYCYKVSPKVYLRRSTELIGEEEINLFYSVYELVEDQAVCIEKDEMICCGKGIRNSATIRTGFNHAGNYLIVIEYAGCLEERIIVGEIRYTVPLEQQTLALKQSVVTMDYGDILYLDTILVDGEAQNSEGTVKGYPDNYEIVIEDGESAVQAVVYEHRRIQEDKEEGREDEEDESSEDQSQESESYEDQSRERESSEDQSRERESSKDQSQEREGCEDKSRERESSEDQSQDSENCEDQSQEREGYEDKADEAHKESESNKEEPSQEPIDKDNQRDYIEAIGINKPDAGEAEVSIWLKATPFHAASEPVKLKVIVNRIQTNLQIAMPQRVKIYDQLPIQIQLKTGEHDITEELLADSAKGSIDFCIQPIVPETDSEDSTVQETGEIVVNSTQLVCEKNGCHQYFLPVTNEHFSRLEAGQEYIIRAAFAYEEDVSQNTYPPYCCNECVQELTLFARDAKLELSVDQEVPLDYRTYFGENGLAKLVVDMNEINKIAEQDTIQQEINVEEKQKIVYQALDYDNNVIKIIDDINNPFSPANNTMPIQVAGVGNTEISVQASGSKVYAIDMETIDIAVKNSPLYDEDFVIKLFPASGCDPMVFEYSKEGEGFEKWLDYLEEHNNWINSTMVVALSDTGAQYYNSIVTNQEGSAKGRSVRFGSSQEKQEYCFWAEHTERSASTRQEKGGTRTFTVGIDLEAPKLKSFEVDNNDFAPTRTETEQYYAQDFILTGSFRDTTSGVCKVEYTTNCHLPERERVWQEAKITHNGSDTAFRIVLSDGRYNAIAVRAYDYAGNISQTKYLSNKKGAFVEIVVDSKAPEIAVTAASGGRAYSGEAKYWTKNGVYYTISYIGEGCPYAELYQFEAAYETIGDAVNGTKNKQYLWEPVPADEEDTGIYRVGVEHLANKNGYYYFRAVSKSGVVSKKPCKERILLQQTLPAKKELVETGVADSRKNEWYNKQSGVPIISFAYPEYNSGVTSGEYGAPITIHYNLMVKDESGNVTTLVHDNQATIGVQNSNDYRNGQFVTTCDDLGAKSICFDGDGSQADGYPRDGIYTLEYWISDKAGNQSEKETKLYKIDCHEPTNLSIKVADLDMAVDSPETIYYQQSYQNAIDGSAAAEYGISGKASVKVLKARNIGDWKNLQDLEDGDSFRVDACSRCFLYVIAEDMAGNTAEGWTQGIVVDNQAPTGNGTVELILEPEGANKHGFYNKDIPVKIDIKDAPDVDNCAALMKVDCTIGAEGSDMVTQKELFSFAKEMPTEAELIGASGFEIMELIDAALYESNETYIQVTATDRSENSAISMQKFQIDVTKPEVDISFDNNNTNINKEGMGAQYYKTDRMASIHVKELNFDPTAIEVHITKDGKKCDIPLSDWTSKGIDHYATLGFQEDGVYTMSVVCTDLADNISDEVVADTFIIDKTPPKAAVELIGNNNNTSKEGYFNAKVTVAITIMEHNFHEDGFRLNANDHSGMGVWNHNDDEHTIQVYFDGDGQYSVGLEYTDLAGNSIENVAPLEFIIDTQVPKITISGVIDGSANAGDIVPVIMVQDENLAAESTIIEVATGTGKVITVAKETTAGTGDLSNSPNMVDAALNGGTQFTYTLTDMAVQADDIYYLTVTTSDFAGNQDTQTLRFSLNRRGSTYDMSKLSNIMEKYYNTYQELTDMEIIEMNVDKIEDFHMYLSRNGQMITDEVALTKEESGSEQLGYTYKYKIRKENFAKEGIYRIGFYSKDRAGNEVNNSLDLNGRDIQFVIDDTPPKVVIEGIETGKVYGGVSQAFHVMVTDNFKLKEAELLLVNQEGEELDKWDYCALVDEQGEVATFTIPEQETELSLLFHACDAAGNELSGTQNSEMAPTNFMVTTNKWAQIGSQPVTIFLEEDTPFTILIVVIPVITAAVGIGAVTVWKRKKTERSAQ